MAPEMGQGLSLQMGQRLEMVMTPQMIQSMEMLQLPVMALEQRIQQELLENPALELLDMRDSPDTAQETAEDASGEGDSAESGESASGPSAEGETPESEWEASTASDEATTVEDLRHVDDLDYDYDSYYDEAPPHRAQSDGEDVFDPVENAPGRDISFPEHLENQLGFLEVEPRVLELARRIIHHLDRTGYLNTPPEEIAAAESETPLDPAPTEEELAAALDVVQSLDPAGVGARDAKECLLLQIEAMEGEHPFEREVVEKHLEDLAANRLPQIARSLGVSIEEVKGAAAFIRSLDPHPGLEYSEQSVTHVQPDVVCELQEDGGFEVRLVGSSQPDISDMFLALFDTTKRGKQLREEYLNDPEKAAQFKQMQAMTKNGEDGRMLREKYQSARWLVTAIQQRERTLLRVSKEIVQAQAAYLSGQTNAPAPLMMQEIADRVGVDISTVSRAVRDKYIDTPRGLKALRMFFTRAVGGSGGRKERSNVQIMNRIREIIEAEDKSAPLKDDEIQALLLKEGIDIKRRTVAKYRSNLGYPNHSQRREY
jgi:RNA polymerase sigma-54 factor